MSLLPAQKPEWADPGSSGRTPETREGAGVSGHPDDVNALCVGVRLTVPGPVPIREGFR